jgi:hypothetical protein
MQAVEIGTAIQYEKIRALKRALGYTHLARQEIQSAGDLVSVSRCEELLDTVVDNIVILEAGKE